MNREAALCTACLSALGAAGLEWGPFLTRFLQPGRTASARSHSPPVEQKERGPVTERRQARSGDAAPGSTRIQVSVHVDSVVYFPDGKLLASGGRDKHIRLWDVATGTRLRKLTGHEHTVDSLAVSPDGKLLASTSPDRSARLWNVETGKEFRRLQLENPPIAVRFAPDGRSVAVGDYADRLYLWNVGTGKHTQYPGEARVATEFVTFSPDFRLAVQVFNRNLVVRETASGKVRHSFLGDDKNPAAWDYAAFSPDGATLAMGGPFVELLDLQRGRSMWRHEGPTIKAPEDTPVTYGRRCLAFAPDGKVLVTANVDCSLTLWEVATGKPILTFGGHTARIRCVAFSPDGRRLASGGDDKRILQWNVDRLILKECRPKTDLSPDELRSLWDDLGGRDVRKAYRSIHMLAAAGPRAVTFLKERLPPVPRPDEQRLARLIADLESDRFATREKSTRELEKLSELALPALRKILENKPSLELRRRIVPLVERIDQPILSGHRLFAVRAVTVLEQAGSPEAREVLEQLAKGAPGARLTQEARAALDRLVKRTGPKP